MNLEKTKIKKGNLSSLFLESPGFGKSVVTSFSEGSHEVWSIGNLKNERAVISNLGLSINPCFSEIVLKSYLRNGLKFAREFNGEFAFVIHQRDKNLLLAARDILGNQPLYYLPNREGLPKFSFDIRAFVSNRVQGELNYAAIGEYLLGDCLSWERTLYRSISRVPPGYILSWQDSKQLDRVKYWEVPEEVEGLSYSDAGELIRNKFSSALERQIPNDHAFALSLSGGLDSSVVFAGLVSEFPDRVSRFTPFTTNFTGFECDETQLVSQLLEAFDFHTRAKFIDADLGNKNFIAEEFQTFRDFPNFANGLFTAQIKKAVADSSCEYLFTGYGADELFSFPQRKQEKKCSPIGYLMALSSRICPSKVKNFMREQGVLTSWVPPWFTKKFRDDTQINETLSSAFLFPSFLNPARRSSYKALFDPWAVRMREFESRSAREYGINMLSPFQDLEFIEACYSVPGEYFSVDPQSNTPSPKIFERIALGEYLPLHCRNSRTKVDFTGVVNLLLKKVEDGEFSKNLPFYDLGWVDREVLLRSYTEFVSGRGSKDRHSNAWNYWALLGAAEILKEA